MVNMHRIRWAVNGAVDWLVGKPHSSSRPRYPGLAGQLKTMFLGSHRAAVQEYSDVTTNHWGFYFYGPKLKYSGINTKLFRGYVQVEPEQLPGVVDILKQLGVERAKSGKTTEFKFLAAKIPTEKSRGPFLQERQYGRYKNLIPGDPVLVLYGDDLGTIKEILGELSRMSEWVDIEAYRNGAARYRFGEKGSRRTWTSSYSDKNGREWRSLCYNEQPGFSEHAHEREDVVYGSPTGDFKFQTRVLAGEISPTGKTVSITPFADLGGETFSARQVQQLVGMIDPFARKGSFEILLSLNVIPNATTDVDLSALRAKFIGENLRNGKDVKGDKFFVSWERMPDGTRMLSFRVDKPGDFRDEFPGYCRHT